MTMTMIMTTNMRRRMQKVIGLTRPLTRMAMTKACARAVAIDRSMTMDATQVMQITDKTHQMFQWRLMYSILVVAGVTTHRILINLPLRQMPVKVAEDLALVLVPHGHRHFQQAEVDLRR